MSDPVTRADVSLGRCHKRGCEGTLRPQVSADGSAWLSDTCDRCKASWWHDPPSTPPSPGEAWVANLDAQYE